MANCRRDLLDARDQYFTPEKIRLEPVSAIRSFVEIADSLLVRTFESRFDAESKNTALIALGGYGRKELCPHSDLDILILHQGDHKEENIARLVRALWDMGLPLGCVVRSIEECRRILGEDLATDTALLEARYLTGSKSLFRRLQHSVVDVHFRKKKKSYQNELLTALHDGLQAEDTSLYLVEPDIKNGICALRDCHRLIWYGKIQHERYHEQEIMDALPFSKEDSAHFSDAYRVLLSIRCALHCVAGRRLDILEMSQQGMVAGFLGLGPDGAGVLMERYFRTVRTIRSCISVFLEKQRKAGLIKKIRWMAGGISVGYRVKLLDGIISAAGSLPPQNTEIAAWILGMYLTAQSYGASFSLQIHNLIGTLSARMSKSDLVKTEVNGLFRKILTADTNAGWVIKSMYETGILTRIIPELESIKCLVEYDSYHEFTVDHHTMIALSILDSMILEKKGPVSNILTRISDLSILRLSILLHDIGKSLPGDHASNGAEIATNVCDRLGFEEKDRELVVFLVRHHLDLSNLSFRREPEEKVLSAFAGTLGDCFRLDLLYILTIVDIRSVGRKSWTGWIDVQLQSVYEKARLILEKKTGIFTSGENFELAPDMVKRAAELTGPDDLLLDMQHFPGFEKITVYSYDRTHLFADIAGCLSSEGYNILSARILTTPDRKAVDLFYVEPDDTTSLPSEERLKNIAAKWKRIQSGAVTAEFLINERTRLYPSRQKRNSSAQQSSVLINNAISDSYSVIEIKTLDNFGLLYRISNVLACNGINIVSAKLSTRAARAVDVFYVNADGQKVKDTLLDEIKLKLEESLF